MPRWKIQAATTALVAMLVAATASLPIPARELQPLATATSHPQWEAAGSRCLAALLL